MIYPHIYYYLAQNLCWHEKLDKKNLGEKERETHAGTSRAIVTKIFVTLQEFCAPVFRCATYNINTSLTAFSQGRNRSQTFAPYCL